MNSWSRTHKNPEIKVLVIAQLATVDYLISVIEPKGARRIPLNHLEREPEQAKAAADRLVQIHYPHNCRDSGCGNWVRIETPFV